MNLTNIFFIFIFTFFTSFLLVPLVNKIGLVYNFVDNSREINPRKIKKVRIGGVALFVSYMLSLIASSYLFNFLEKDSITYIGFFIFGSFFIFVIGLIDDIFNISPWPRLIIQISLAIVFFSLGIKIEAIELNFLNLDFIILPTFLSFLITILWIAGLINAINWIDGLDGLAASTLTIASSFYLISSYQNSYELISILTISIIGCCLGFLIFNRYPSKILMGDSGSYFLGFNLALISILGSSITGKYEIDQFNGLIFNLPHALMLLAVPIFDMIFVIISRILNSKSPFYPDKSHLHHRLQIAGFNAKNSLIIICSISIVSSLIGTKLFL